VKAGFGPLSRFEAVRLTPSGRISTLSGEHTFDRHKATPEADVLTARQQEIWQFLVDYVDRHGYPPTVREIGEAVGLASPSTVHAHLANLERAGLLRRDPTKPRALELIGHRREAARAEAPEPEHVKLPLLGQIAAGGPLLAEQNVEDELAVPEPLGRRADFLLRVKGDSMIEAGILDGDVLVVQRAQDARDGEIVVALAGDDESADEATVKTFYREDNRVRLQPENAALEPIYADHVQILGRVTGVFRTL
jgi:repressor LexA